MNRYLWIAATIMVLMTLVQGQDVQVQRPDGSSFSGSVIGAFDAALRIKTAAGEVDIPWRDMALVNAEAPVAMTLKNGDKITARLLGVADGDTLILESSAFGAIRLKTAELAAVPAPPANPEVVTPVKPTDWQGRLSLAASVTAGNRDLLSATLDSLLEKNWTHDHLEFRFNATYAQADGNEQANSMFFRSLLRHYYEPTFYSYGSLEVGRDEIQDIEVRGLVNVGAGYELWKNSDKELFDIEGGIGYRHESYTTDQGSRNDATVRGALIYKDIFFDDLEFSQSFEMIVPVNDPGAFLGRAETVMALPLSEEWSFRLTVRIDYLADPADDKDSLDLLSTVGLEYRF